MSRAKMMPTARKIPAPRRPPHRGAGALLQRGSGHRQGGRRLPRRAARSAAIYVYDNNSTDRTAEVARAAGAVVRRELHQGKGNVVRRMFADIDADIYVLVDGDATYDAPSARGMIERLLEDRLDMVVAARVDREEAAYRPGHRTGNRLLTRLRRARCSARAFTDILSGYRVFSRRFVKSFPVLSRRLRDRDRAHGACARARAAGRRDARRRITRGRKARCRSSAPGATACASSGRICGLYRSERPLPFFSGDRHRAGDRLDRARDPGLRDLFRARHRAAPADRHPVDRPDAAGVPVLSAGLMLDTVTRGRREMKLLAYLAQRAPGEERRRS